MKKILVIRFSSIGDIVLTSPIVRCLKKQLPDTKIYVLTKKTNKQLYESSPYVDKVFAFDNNLKEITEVLKNEKVDFIVDLHKNIRSISVKLALGVRSSSFPKLNFAKYLMVQFKLNILPDTHIVDRYFKAVSSLGVVNDNQGLDFFIPESKVFNQDNLPETFRNGYFVAVIGGKHFTKIFPVQKIIEVIGNLENPFILLGGPEDASRGDQIAHSLGEKVWNTCGKLNLAQSASLIKNAQAVMTNDTGLMHIAAAFHKPIVSVWGNTIPAFGMYPYIPKDKSQSVIFENKTLSCRPCSKIGHKKCPKGHFRCMLDLDSIAIATELRRISE
ncbi:MAG: glycosyl transferase [Bacteroidetes bacterium HGW-Bacteroidetes-1]|nr:MAG: glycosyl transferase [Bacteroidetes bacterium HGW-Bacteroidetes-1]